MATILFVMKYPLHRKENLQAKFDGQMTAARALGHTVYCIGWNREGMWLVGDGSRELLKRNAFAFMPGYDHTKIFMDLMASVRKALSRQPIDLLYLRFMPTFAGALRAMRMLKEQGGKLVMEHPTYPREKERARFFLRKPVFLYTDMILRYIHPMVDLYALIGQKCDGVLDGRAAVNICNGVDVDTLPLHAPNPHIQAVNLLALASMSGWQGYDRILRALASYRGETEVRLHMVGSEGDGSLARWKVMAESFNLPDKVLVYGPLYGEDLDRVASACDVGICGLAWFRYGLSSVMTLKMREFMARGIPFVYAAEDPSIPEDGRFSLRVSNDEAPVDMAEIVGFAKKAKESREVPELMREFARAHMSWEEELRRVLERLNL